MIVLIWLAAPIFSILFLKKLTGLFSKKDSGNVMLERIKFFKEHGQSNNLIKNNLISAGYPLDEINQGIEKYDKRSKFKNPFRL